MFWNRFFPRLLLAVVLGASLFAVRQNSPVAAQAAQTKAKESAAVAPAENAAHEMTAAHLEAFVDGFLPAELERDDIPGAVLVIVKDGKLLYSRGFGYADVEKKKPVSVDDTLFRPGSVSKTFTCTAVMQLVEQGKLDLDRDVNDYLDFKIPATYQQPVTLRRIMTHTAGFEEWGKELFVLDPADLELPSVYLPKHLPNRIFAPGAMPAYSNYAMSVAGYIVQRVSGERFEDYIQNHIYRPLGMIHSTFEQPLPPNLRPLMSNGYQHGSDKPKDFEYVNGAPAGSMSTSGADMARYAIAHLQDGKYGDTQILRPETAKLMHSRAYGPIPELNGMALCFFEENQNGHTIIGHGGDTGYFHSHLHLILDSNVGMFISINSRGRGMTQSVDVRQLFWDKFLDRYFPGTPALPPAVLTASEDSKSVSGTYITSRRGETTIKKIGAILGEVTFTARPDGTIVAEQMKGVNGNPRHWREIAPMVYRDVDGQNKIAFKKNANGRWEIFSDAAAFGLQQVSGSDSKGFFMYLLYFSIGILVLAVLLWPVSAIIRRHYHQPLNLTASELRMRRLVRIICLVDIAVFLGWHALFNHLQGNIGAANHHLDPYLYLLHVVEWVGVLGTILAVLYAYRSLTSPNRWVWSKLFDSLIALACIGAVWIAYIGNLLHFGTKY